MSSFVSYEGDLYIKCDSCGETNLVEKDQTDRLLVNDWVHGHAWKTIKIDGRWKHFCSICDEVIRQEKAKEFYRRK